MRHGDRMSAYLRLGAQQFINRLLGVAEQRVLDHTKHVAPLLFFSSFSSLPPSCPVYCEQLALRSDGSSSALREQPRWRSCRWLGQDPDVLTKSALGDLSSTVFLLLVETEVRDADFSPSLLNRRNEQMRLHSHGGSVSAFLRLKFPLLPA